MATLRYDIIGNNVSLNQAVSQSVASLNTLNIAAEKSNQAIKNQIIPIKELEKELAALKRQKVNIADANELSIINRRIQELTAEITRFQRAGTQGFDTFGSAIASAGSNAENLGKGLTKGLGILRQVAYILPGIGVAGIFNLAFEAITAAGVSLDLFNTKSQKTKEELKEIQKAQDEQYGKTGFIEAATNLSELTEKIKLAKNGFLDKKKVLEEYNSTLGLTVGQVNSLGEAEQKIIDKGPAYLQFLLLKAKAEYAFKQAAEASYNIDVQNDKLTQAKGTPNASAGQFFGKGATSLADPNSNFSLIKPIEQLRKEYDKAGQSIPDNINKINVAQTNGSLATQIAGEKQVASLKKVQSQSEKVADQTQKQLEKFAKDNGFNVFAFKDNKGGGSIEGIFKSISDSLDDIFNKSNKLAGQSGLDGYALEVQKVNDKYKELNAQIEKNIQKAQDSIGKRGGVSSSELQILQDKADRNRKANAAAQEKELSDLKIAEASRVANEVQRINDEFAVKSGQSRAKEILQINAKYDAEVVKAQGNAEILNALDNGRLSAIQAVNDKYAAIQQDLQDKIADIDAQARADISGKQESDTQKIQSEWDKRKAAAAKYYDELRRLAVSEQGLTGNTTIDNIVKGFKIGTLNNNQTTTNTTADNAASADISRKILEPLTSGLSRSVRQFGQNFFDTITNVDTYAKGSFTSIFSDLTSKLTTSLNKVFFDIILNGLSKSLTEAINKSSSGSGGSGGGGGLLNSDGSLSGAGAFSAISAIGGGIISSSSPKTSLLGQGLGSALSGAGTGAAIGSIVPGIGTLVGGIVGGAVGLLGGIFGASKAQKELQAKQLAEQQQQTALLKASLAYTSQIIGRDTANGVVTGISVGSFGQLVATVSGKDLQFVLDRTKNGR